MTDRRLVGVTLALTLLAAHSGCGTGPANITPPNINYVTGEVDTSLSATGETADPGDIAATSAEGALIRSTIKLLSDAATTPGGSHFDVAKDYLNAHYGSTKVSDFHMDGPERDYLAARFGDTAPKAIAELESQVYTFRDSRHIEDCLLLASIARRVAGDGEDLDRVERLFHWLVRQVQLVPSGTLGLPGLPQAAARPYDVLLRAMAIEEGEWTERSWAFLSLCRQIDLDAGIVRFTPPADPTATDAATTKTEAAAPPQPRVFAVAVLVEGVPYLFDCRIGLPIPGPGGKGIATLEQAMTDPDILARLDLPDAPYPVHQADLAAAGKVKVYLDSTIGYLSPRMRQFQKELAGRDRMVLFRNPAEVDAAFAQALGDRFGGTEFWTLPMEVETRLFTDPTFNEATKFALQFFDPQLPLMPARMGQLRGDLDRSVESYAAFRFPLNPVLMLDGKTPIPPNVQQILDFYATYYLGLVKLDQGELDTAADFFRQTLNQVAEVDRVLQAERDKMASAEPGKDAAPLPKALAEPFFLQYRLGAISNLGLIAEAQGDKANAEKYLTMALPTGQAHGNQLRARPLLWDDPFATTGP